MRVLGFEFKEQAFHKNFRTEGPHVQDLSSKISMFRKPDYKKPNPLSINTPLLLAFYFNIVVGGDAKTLIH